MRAAARRGFPPSSSGADHSACQRRRSRPSTASTRRSPTVSTIMRHTRHRDDVRMLRSDDTGFRVNLPEIDRRPMVPSRGHRGYAGRTTIRSFPPSAGGNERRARPHCLRKTLKLTRSVGKPALIAARVARQIGRPRSQINCGAFVFSTSQNPPHHPVQGAEYLHDRGRIDDRNTHEQRVYTGRPLVGRPLAIRVLRAAAQSAAIPAPCRRRATPHQRRRRLQREEATQGWILLSPYSFLTPALRDARLRAD